MVHQNIQPFISRVKNYTRQLRDLAAEGRKIIGYFCTYTPVEVIHAAGFVPVRILGGSGSIERAYSLVPDFICSYMKQSLEKALAGEYDYLSGVIQGYTCDVACGLVNIWKENVPGEIFVTVPLPYNDTPAGRDFFRAEMDNLVERLNSIGGTFSPAALEGSLELYGSIRQQLSLLYKKGYAGQLPLSAEDMLYIGLTGAITPPETFLDMLGSLSRSIMDMPLTVQRDGVPVLISGSLIENPSVFQAIETSGGRVVADDLCTGMRALMPQDHKGSDPLERLMNQHFKRIQCPSRCRATERLPVLTSMLESSGARGIVFLFQKFCTPHLADFPTLSEALKQLHIPSLMIEVDETTQMDGQVQTRLEGFFEMLRSKND